MEKYDKYLSREFLKELPERARSLYKKIIDDLSKERIEWLKNLACNIARTKGCDTSSYSDELPPLQCFLLDLFVLDEQNRIVDEQKRRIKEQKRRIRELRKEYHERIRQGKSRSRDHLNTQNFAYLGKGSDSVYLLWPMGEA